jgi:hypothetical protein
LPKSFYYEVLLSYYLLLDKFIIMRDSHIPVTKLAMHSSNFIYKREREREREREKEESFEEKKQLPI